MKEIIKKIMEERNRNKDRLTEALDLLVELKEKCDLNIADEEYINEIVEREIENKSDIEIELENDLYQELRKEAVFLNISLEELVEKILEIQLNHQVLP
jgi:ethanolamine ammonia-lyase small subunit